MKYVILGMHKSGTTLLTKILHESGINMGPFNEKGSYYKGEDCERVDIFNIISDMLQSHDLHSLDTIPPFDERQISNQIVRFANTVKSSDSEYKVWGFKNPRTIFIYKYIKPILGDHKLICIYRNLESVISHYSRSNIFYISKAIKAWRIYNTCMLDIIKNANSDIIVINFERIFKDDVAFNNLEKFVGLKLKDLRNANRRKKANKIKRFICECVVRTIFVFNVGKIKDITRELDLFES